MAYTVKKSSSEDSIYDFTVSITNRTDKIIEEFDITSSIYYFANYDLSHTIHPNETIEIVLSYDHYPSPNLQGRTPIALYFMSGDWEDNYLREYYSISNNIEVIDFPDVDSEAGLQLKAEIICNVEEAYYEEVIPCTLVLYNPTDIKFTNLEFNYWFSKGEAIDELKPGETITRDLTITHSFNEYQYNIYDTEDIYYSPRPRIRYNEDTYYMYEWCSNYDEIDLPEIRMLMPPKTNEIVNEITAIRGDLKTFKVLYDNTLAEEIEIEYIGYPESGSYDDFPNTRFKKNTSTLTLNAGRNAYTTDDDGNLFLELLIIGYGEETDKLYWIHDTFPVTQIIPTPTPIPTDTPAPAFTPAPTAEPEKIVSASIKSNNGISADGSIQNIEIQISNRTSNSISSIKVYDENENVLHEVSVLRTNATLYAQLDVTYNEELNLVVEYEAIDGIVERLQTNTITTINFESSSDQSPSRTSTLAVVLIGVAFIALSVGVVVIIRRKQSKNKD